MNFRIRPSYQFYFIFLFCSLLFACQNKSEQKTTFTSREMKSGDYYKSRISTLTQGQSGYLTGHENGAISMWDSISVEGEKPHHSWLAHESPIRSLQVDFNGVITSLSADGSWATWSKEGQILSRERLKSIQPNTMLKVTENLQIFGDARGAVIAMNGSNRLWRTAGEHGRAVFGLGYLDQEHLLSIGSDGWGRCWLIATGDNCGALPLHKGWVTALKSLDSVMVTGGSDGYVKIWDNGTLLDLHMSRIDKDQRQLARPMTEYRAHQLDLTELDEHDGWLVSGSEDGSVTRLKYDIKSRSLHHGWTVQDDQFKPVMSVLLDTTQDQIIIAGGSGANLWILSTQTGKTMHHISL
jgi:WD40 repeat protein